MLLCNKCFQLGIKGCMELLWFCFIVVIIIIIISLCTTRHIRPSRCLSNLLCFVSVLPILQLVPPAFVAFFLQVVLRRPSSSKSFTVKLASRFQNVQISQLKSISPQKCVLKSSYPPPPQKNVIIEPQNIFSSTPSL